MEIRELIFLKLPALDLGHVERTSSYFRALIMNGKLWSPKDDLVGKKALRVMRLKIEKMVEKKKERRCICPIHKIIIKNIQKN